MTKKGWMGLNNATRLDEEFAQQLCENGCGHKRMDHYSQNKLHHTQFHPGAYVGVGKCEDCIKNCLNFNENEFDVLIETLRSQS